MGGSSCFSRGVGCDSAQAEIPQDEQDDDDGTDEPDDSVHDFFPWPETGETGLVWALHAPMASRSLSQSRHGICALTNIAERHSPNAQRRTYPVQVLTSSASLGPSAWGLAGLTIRWCRVRLTEGTPMRCR